MAVKYKIDRKKLRLRIWQMPGAEYGAYGHVELTEEQTEEINKFVEEHKLGIRISYDIWRFKNKECLMLFMLKYG